jgi:hypothetical protein
MVGEKDDGTPAAKCQAVTGKTDFGTRRLCRRCSCLHAELRKACLYLGHHMIYYEKATQDAQQRADAFMATHMK